MTPSVPFARKADNSYENPSDEQKIAIIKILFNNFGGNAEDPKTEEEKQSWISMYNLYMGGTTLLTTNPETSASANITYDFREDLSDKGYAIEDIPEQTYTGNPIEPVITVSNADGPLYAGCYSVEYKNNTSAGTGSVTVTGTGRYVLTLSKNFTIKRNCIHIHTELKNEVKATCTKKGYSGDTVCLDCGETIEAGHEIPIDPTAHDYDYTKGEVTTPATHYTWGETCYSCRHNPQHKLILKNIEPIPFEDGRDANEFIEDMKDLSGNAAPKVVETKDEAGNEVTIVSINGISVEQTVRDPESGKETITSAVWIKGLEKSYTYTGSAIKPEIHVYDGTRKLTERKDYTLSYRNNKNAGTEASILIKFKGGYSASEQKTAGFEITKAELGKDITAYDNGTAKKADKLRSIVPELIWTGTGKKVNGSYFDFSYREIKDNESIVTITPKPQYSQNFNGQTTAKVKSVDNKKQLAKATVKFEPASYAYTGKEIIPSYTVRLGGNILEKDKDFIEKIQNNILPGTAKVIIEAKPGNEKGFLGCKTASFKITKTRKLENAEPFTYEAEKSVPYAKGGAMPPVTVKDGDVTLKEGRDYTLSYAKNKASTTGETAEVKVKGKGNYTGSVTLKYAITKQSFLILSDNIVASDQFVKRSRLRLPSIEITDLNGKKLKKGVDYTTEKTDTSAPGNTETYGTAFVTLTGKGNYKEEKLTISFRYMQTLSANIGKAENEKKIDDQIYTGGSVKLSNADLTGVLKLGQTVLVPGTDFKVIGYKDNAKKGIAKVTVQGIGAYAGQKTLTFKIVQRPVDYKGAIV